MRFSRSNSKNILSQVPRYHGSTYIQKYKLTIRAIVLNTLPISTHTFKLLNEIVYLNYVNI